MAAQSWLTYLGFGSMVLVACVLCTIWFTLLSVRKAQQILASRLSTWQMSRRDAFCGFSFLITTCPSPTLLGCYILVALGMHCRNRLCCRFFTSLVFLSLARELNAEVPFVYGLFGFMMPLFGKKTTDQEVQDFCFDRLLKHARIMFFKIYFFCNRTCSEVQYSMRSVNYRGACGLAVALR